jgi:hypothetical protein
MGRGGPDGWRCTFAAGFGSSASVIKNVISSSWDDSKDGDPFTWFDHQLKILSSCFDLDGVITLSVYLPGTLTDIFPDYPDGVFWLEDIFDCEDSVGCDGSYSYVGSIHDDLHQRLDLIQSAIETLKLSTNNNEKNENNQRRVWLSSLSRIAGFLEAIEQIKPEVVVQQIDVN